MYDYQTEKPKLFTEDGVKTVLNTLRKIQSACEVAGCITRGRALGTGDSWTALAAQDFLEEHGYVWINKQAPSTNDQTIHIRGGS